MYLQKEADKWVKAFRLYLPMEAFMYLRSKLPNVVVAEAIKNDSTILYYNTLQVES